MNGNDYYRKNKAAIDLNILQMMFERLKLANWGNLLLVFVMSSYLWNSWPREQIVVWASMCLAVTLLRIVFFYRRYERSEVDEKNVQTWLRLWPISLAITNLLWAAACIALADSRDPQFILIGMFCFFVVITSGVGTLAAHMPSFLAHGFGLTIPLSIYFLSLGDSLGLAFGLGVCIFYFVAFVFARSNNKNIIDLISLRLRQQSLTKEMEEKSKQAEAALLEKNRFLAAASHDLRQPLHSIGLLVASLHNTIDRSARSEQILEDTQISLTALQNAFNGILDVSRLDAGVVHVSKTHFCAMELEKELTIEFRTLAEDKGIFLDLMVEKDLALFTDQSLLKRILRNLISNAIRYTHEGGVKIEFKRIDDNQVSIDVIDSGIGIETDKQQDIFSEYYQINNPARDRNQGFGLGLSIVKRMCHLLEIPLRLDSTLGKGTTFSLALAQGDSSLARKTSRQFSSDKDISSLNILMVDDDEGVRRAVSNILESWGCNCLVTADGQSAINEINKNDFIPDLVLSDYRLANFETGIDVIEMIQDEINESIPSMIITGETLPSKVRDIEQKDIKILYKPVSEYDLRDNIVELLKKDNQSK